MRKLLLTLLLTLSIIPCCLSAQCVDIEARAGYYYLMDKTARKIYQNGMPEYQIEAAFLYYNPWVIWVNGGYMTQKGHSIGLDNPTRMWMVPVAIGAKYVFELECGFDAYLGLGATYSFLHTKDDSPYVHKYVKKNAFGGVARSGMRYKYCESWFVEGFIDYTYTKFNFRGNEDNIIRKNFDMSGFLFGAGIGCTF